MKGPVSCTVKGVEKQHFAKLDPKKKKLSILAKESSLIATMSFDLGVDCTITLDGETGLSLAGKKSTSVLRFASRAERDSWMDALQAAAAGSPVLSSNAVGRSSSSANIAPKVASLNTGVVTRQRSRSQSDPEIVISALGDGKTPLVVSPRSEQRSEFDLIMAFSKRFAAEEDERAQDKLLISLAESLLEKDAPLAATQFAAAAMKRPLSRNEEAPVELNDAAARVIQKAEQLVALGASAASASAASTKYLNHQAWSKEITPMTSFLEDVREVLSEGISEKDTDVLEKSAKFAADLFAKVLVPICNSALAKLPKPPTKFVVCSFELTASLSDRLPYDGVNLGVIMQDFTPTNKEFFVRLMRLVEIKLAQLGESAPVLMAPNWTTGFPGLRLSTEESFLGLELVGGVEQFVQLFEVEHEEKHILQTMMLLSPHFVVGDRALLKKYQKDLQSLLDSHFLIPLAFNGKATYREFAVAKLPPKKKLELFEPTQQIRKIKAGKFLGYLGNRWCGDLFLVKDHPFPKLISLRDEFWVPLYGVIVALRLLHDVPSEHSMEQAMEMLIQNHTLGKRSARHLTGALEKVVKYRMLAQLKNKSGNEYLYHKGVSNKPVGAWEISGKYLEKVMEIYSTVLPVVIGADDYFHSNVLTKNTFNLENLKLETPWIRLLGLQRMGLDEEGLKECIALSEGQSFSMQRIVSVAENLSNTRVAMGDYNGAIVDLGMLKEVCLDQKSRKTIAAVDGKLSVVVNLAGQADQAASLRRAALSFMDASRTAKRDRVCLIINEGCHLLSLGQNAEATEIFRAALKQASSTRNRRLHKRSIQLCLPELLHNLATSLARGGLYNEAIPFFRQQLVLVSERFGADSLEAAFANLNLAAALDGAGNLKGACAAALAGSTVFARVFGRDDEHVVSLRDFCSFLAEK